MLTQIYVAKCVTRPQLVNQSHGHMVPGIFVIIGSGNGLFGAKPLPKPMSTNCPLDPKEHFFVKFESNHKTFLKKKYFSKCLICQLFCPCFCMPFAPGGAIWHHGTLSPLAWVIGLLPEGIKTLPILTCHKWGPVIFTWGQFHMQCWQYRSLLLKTKHFNYSQISHGQMSLFKGPSPQEFSTLLFTSHNHKPVVLLVPSDAIWCMKPLSQHWFNTVNWMLKESFCEIWMTIYFHSRKWINLQMSFAKWLPFHRWHLNAKFVDKCPIDSKSALVWVMTCPHWVMTRQQSQFIDAIWCHYANRWYRP